MGFGELEGRVEADEGKDEQVGQGVVFPCLRQANHFLHADTSDGTSCGYSPKAYAADLLRIKLNDVEEENSVVIAHAAPGEK